jgi:4,5-dihydroxyphthalate decarboxylase
MPIKRGEVRSALVEFDFCGPEVPNRGFKTMVRDAGYDAGELAIGTYLQALAFGKPLVMLPVAVMSRLQHHFLEYNEALGTLRPKDLEGRRIGVRAYTQTTGIWLRGLLQHDYGVDLTRLTWVSTDDPHLAEYPDPPNVERVARPSGALLDMLKGGEIDAAIIDGKASRNPGIAPVIAEPEKAADSWLARSGFVPVNHVFVVDARLSRERPDVIRDIYRMFSEAKALLPRQDGPDLYPLGREALHRSLEAIIAYSVEQQIIPRSMAVDDLYDETTRGLEC